MPTYKVNDVLKMGFTNVALPGNVITASEEDVEKYGWADRVTVVDEPKAPEPSRPAGS